LLLSLQALSQITLVNRRVNDFSLLMLALPVGKTIPELLNDIDPTLLGLTAYGNRQRIKSTISRRDAIAGSALSRRPDNSLILAATA